MADAQVEITEAEREYRELVERFMRSWGNGHLPMNSRDMRAVLEELRTAAVKASKEVKP